MNESTAHEIGLRLQLHQCPSTMVIIFNDVNNVHANNIWHQMFPVRGLLTKSSNLSTRAITSVPYESTMQTFQSGGLLATGYIRSKMIKGISSSDDLCQRRRDISVTLVMWIVYNASSFIKVKLYIIKN
jgi:hypothetical protein